MKKTLNYPELWQQKRNELPIDGDPNADWLQMQQVLDVHMPVTAVIKTPYNAKGIKGLYKLLIGISTSVIIYGAVQLYLPAKQNHLQKNVPQKSVPAIPVVDKKDSAAAIPAEKPLAIDKKYTRDTVSANDKVLLQPIKNHPDTIKAPDVAEKDVKDNGIVHRDSMLTPVTPALSRPIDSAAAVNNTVTPVNLNKNTPTGSSKPSKKKRKSKLQVFF